MKGVIYARYSSDNQREESIAGQLRECKEYAERNDITILGTYIDRALSAKTDNRPEFQYMIKDSAKGLFDVVLVWKLDRFARNRYDSARYKNLLTTKLYCGKCGSFMVGESGTSHTMKVHRYYRCVNTKKKKLCDKKAVKKDWIEDLVVNYTMKAIMNDAVMERLIDTLMELQKKESTDLPLLKKQLAETEKGINNMLNAIQAGIFTPSTKQRLDELEETKSQLEVSILQEEMHRPLLTREQIAFFIYRFRKFDVTK